MKKYSDQQFKLYYTRQAKRDIAKLDAVTKKRLGQKLLYYVQSGRPLDYAEPLISSKLGSYRWRVGDYRIVFDVRGRSLFVLWIGHRRDIYTR